VATVASSTTSDGGQSTRVAEWKSGNAGLRTLRAVFDHSRRRWRCPGIRADTDLPQVIGFLR
jgi:hypothetical protein